MTLGRTIKTSSGESLASFDLDTLPSEEIYQPVGTKHFLKDRLHCNVTIYTDPFLWTTNHKFRALTKFLFKISLKSAYIPALTKLLTFQEFEKGKWSFQLNSTTSEEGSYLTISKVTEIFNYMLQHVYTKFKILSKHFSKATTEKALYCIEKA